MIFSFIPLGYSNVQQYAQQQEQSQAPRFLPQQHVNEQLKQLLAKRVFLREHSTGNASGQPNSRDPSRRRTSPTCSIHSAREVTGAGRARSSRSANEELDTVVQSDERSRHSGRKQQRSGAEQQQRRHDELDALFGCVHFVPRPVPPVSRYPLERGASRQLAPSHL